MLPPTYDLCFVALILLGIFAGGAVLSALIVGPVFYARGKREILRTIRRPAVKVSDCLQ